MQIYALRLTPGQDLKQEIIGFTAKRNIEAGAIISCLGSLSTACIRFAGQKAVASLQGPFEILSVSGTLSENGSHLHICLADSQGKAIGGHLVDGCTIMTTAEVVLGKIPYLMFKRGHDDATGYSELEVYRI